MGTLILVAGENGSGKSRCAENIVAQTTGRRYYIATMQPCSEENLRLLQRVFEHGTISARYLYTVLRP